jgi:pimeloyl-ACP methyl ester carboxylesterase
LYLLNSRRFDEAVSAADAGLVVNLNNTSLYLARAGAEIALGRFDEATSTPAGRCAQKAAVPWSAPQNGNAYEEVLSDGWSPIRAYWQDTSPATGRASRIPRCNSTCPTIRATSRSIRPSRSISGPIRRPCWRHWGQKRPILPAGEGRGVQRDIANATVRFFDTRHFAPETHAPEVAAAIRGFLP